MIINQKKIKNMIFNFTNKHKFTTRIKVNKENVEVIEEVKLLGTIVTNDIKWDKNTTHIVKKAWRRMQLLHNAARFTKERLHLTSIYKTFIRPVLEQSCIVWHSSLTSENSSDLERVQKAAVKLIMGTKHESYEKSLEVLKLEKLPDRRRHLSLTFAKRTLANKKCNICSQKGKKQEISQEDTQRNS